MELGRTKATLTAILSMLEEPGTRDINLISDILADYAETLRTHIPGP